MNLTNIQGKKPRPQGFDYEILATTNIQFNFNDIYNLLDTLTTSINNFSTNVTQSASERLQDQSDKVDQQLRQVEQKTQGLIGYTSEEINYVDYPQAKQRLENVLAYFYTQANETSNTTTNAIQTIQSTIQLQSDIQANQAGLNEIQQQITSTMNELVGTKLALSEMNKQLDEKEITNNYDKLLASLVDNTTLTNTVPEQQLAFSTHLFNVDKTTEKIISTSENPYKILLDDKAKIISGFLNDLENNPNSELLDDTTYQTTKRSLTSLQNQLTNFYQRLTPTYQTTLTTKEGTSSQTTNRTLTAATSSTTANSTQQLNIDPSAYIKGVFVRNNSTPMLTNVVYSKSNAEEFGERQYRTDINKDGSEDIILRNDYSIYIKYGKQNSSFGGGGKTSTFYSKAIKNLKNEETRLEFDRNTRLKIYDQHEEVKHFQTYGQSFDTISIARKKSRERTVAGYLLKLTERIDHSPEKQEITNTSIYKRFILVLPRGTAYTGLKLELTNKTDTVEKLLDKELIQIRFFDPNKEDPNVILEKVERRRQYARIATLTDNENTLNITSPRSNQIVAGRQLLADDVPPEGVANLYRPNTKEIVSSGDILEGYVGTHYNIFIDREDNVAMARMKTEINGQIIKNLTTTKQKDRITIDRLFFSEAGSYSYRSYGIDQNGNETVKQITLNIKIPDITITNIEKNSETQATITAELSHDIDEGTVTFQKNRHGYRTNLSATNQGKSTTDYALKPKMTIIKGQYYQLNDNIALYSKDNQVIAEIDPNT
jgi:hypothetical protein